MNRRGFLARLATGLAGFTILPGAGRVWRAERTVVVAQSPILFWFQTSRVAVCVDDAYLSMLKDLLNTPEALRRISE
jgi:hypothetical protein